MKEKLNIKRIDKQTVELFKLLVEQKKLITKLYALNFGHNFRQQTLNLLESIKLTDEEIKDLKCCGDSDSHMKLDEVQILLNNKINKIKKYLINPLNHR